MQINKLFIIKHMKKLFILLFVIFCASYITAQNQNKGSMRIQAVMDACIAMRDAVSANDTAAIRQSAIALRDCNTTNFNTLQLNNDSIFSLNGHLVFDDAFADSLAEGKNVYEKADSISFYRAQKRLPTRGSIRTKTCFIKAGQSLKYTFTARGHQELAVVAEAGGLVTMKIHITNNEGLDIHKDDTTKVKLGMPQRQQVFDLPINKENLVELKIINCGKKDCSFVVISN